MVGMKLGLHLGLGFNAGGGGGAAPYVPTGTLLAGFETTNEWTQSTSKTASLDTVNKVQGVNAVKYSPSATSVALTMRKALPSFDPQSLKAYAFYVKLPTDIGWQSVESITMNFRVNAAGTLYNGATKTGLSNIWTDGLWMSANVSQLNATFANAGVGNHDMGIITSETNTSYPNGARIGEVTVDALYRDVLANEPTPVVVTFDDAKPTQYSIAYPDLVAAGLKGTFYIPTALVGTGGVMTWTQIQELNAAGLNVAIDGTPDDTPVSSAGSAVNFLAGLETQNVALEAHGIPRTKEFCWPFGFIRQASFGAGIRVDFTNIGLTAGTDTLVMADTTGIVVGQRAVIFGVSTACRVIAVNTNVSIQLSEQMTVTAPGRNISFLTDTSWLYGNGAMDAAIGAGYEWARSTINARMFVGFGYSRRWAMQAPSYPGNGQTGAAMLAIVDAAIAERAMVSFYIHGITSGELPAAEWTIFKDGLKTRQDAGLIRTTTFKEIEARYGNAHPPA